MEFKSVWEFFYFPETSDTILWNSEVNLKIPLIPGSLIFFNTLSILSVFSLLPTPQSKIPFYLSCSTFLLVCLHPLTLLNSFLSSTHGNVFKCVNLLMWPLCLKHFSGFLLLWGWRQTTLIWSINLIDLPPYTFSVSSWSSYTGLFISVTTEPVYILIKFCSSFSSQVKFDFLSKLFLSSQRFS